MVVATGTALLAGAALSAAGGMIAGNQAKQAAKGQAGAANAATAAGNEQFQQTFNAQEPWRVAGGQAVGRMSELANMPSGIDMSNWQQDPGYQFRMQQGQEAINRSASAGGRYQSGGTLKALTAYGQGMGAQEYQNVYNRKAQERSTQYNQLASLAGLGQTSVGQTGQLGAQNAMQAGQNMMGAANAQAAGTVGSANAWSGALNTGLNNWATYQGMNASSPTMTTANAYQTPAMPIGRG